MNVNTFHVSHRGDPSVGISGENAIVQLDCKGQTQEYIDFVKDCFTETFTSICDFKAHVITNLESDDEEPREDLPDFPVLHDLDHDFAMQIFD
jgi:hypothetical protein